MLDEVVIDYSKNNYYIVLLVLVIIFIAIKLVNKNNTDSKNGINKIIKEDEIKKDYVNFNKSLFLYDVTKVLNKLNVCVTKSFLDRLPRLLTNNLLNEYTKRINDNLSKKNTEFFEKTKIISNEICDYDVKTIKVLLEIEDLYYVRDSKGFVIKGDNHNKRYRKLVLTLLLENKSDRLSFKIDNINLIEEKYIIISKKR